MMIHLALSALPDWAAGPELQRFAYVHLAPSLDQMARTYQQAKAGLLPDEPILVVGQPTTVDPSRAPQGQHTLWLQVRMAPGTILGDAKGEIAATDWAEAGRTLRQPRAGHSGTLRPRHARQDPWPAHRAADRNWNVTIPTSWAAIRCAAATIWRRIFFSAPFAAMRTALPRSRICT